MQEPHSLFQLQPDGIGARNFQRLGREIDGINFGVRQLVRQCQRDASRTCADIHQLGTLDSARQLQHRFNQMLGLGTRNQHRRRDHEIQAPEFLVPGDVLRWHAGGALGEHFFVSRSFFRSEFALGMRVEVGTIGAEDEHEQHLGVHAGRAHVGSVETFDRGRERLLQLHGIRP